MTEEDVRRAVEREREACARIVDLMTADERIAIAIRKRSSLVDPTCTFCKAHPLKECPVHGERPLGRDDLETVAFPKKCQVPPEGWYCTRQAGHEGPCAALPTETKPLHGPHNAASDGEQQWPNEVA